jgi:hypothetical protein
MDALPHIIKYFFAIIGGATSFSCWLWIQKHEQALKYERAPRLQLLVASMSIVVTYV